MEAEHQLKIRVYISKLTHIFSRNDVAKGFGISLKTLNRYISPKCRRYHILYAYEVTQKMKTANKNCHKCDKDIETHRRCVECEILIHGESAWCHGCMVIRTKRILAL